MHVILLIIYSILLSIAALRIPFLKKSGLKPGILLAFFWVRCIAAWVHNFIAYRYYPNHGDIWDFFETGKMMKAKLLQGVLWQELYQAGQQMQLHDVIRGELGFRTLSFLNMAFNFLSFDNFYINTLLFSFIAFMGGIALYRVFKQPFPNHAITALVVLLLPSTLFFTACMHKEGVIYLMLGFGLFAWQQQLQNRFTITALLTCALLFGGMIALRTNMVIGLVPGLLAWTLAQKTRLSNKLTVLITLSATATLFIIAACTNPGYNIIYIIISRQYEFAGLQGNSRLYMPALQSAGDFISALPYAFVNGFFEPLPGKAGQPIYTLFSLEVLLIWCMVLLALYYILRYKKGEPLPGFGIFCLLLAIPQLLLIGYVVPFAGAIIRYRSLYLPFILLPAFYYFRSTKWFSKLESRLLNFLSASN